MTEAISSAAAVGASMPMTLTLDDLAAMAEADERHWYEMSPEGVLSVMPPPGRKHAVVATRLTAWFLQHGWAPEQLLQNCGLRISTGSGTGGRIPDLSVWEPVSETDQVYSDLDGLRLAVEIVSPSSVAMDHVTKRGEYAAVGVPRYWIVDRDAANTVIRYALVDGAYVEVGRQPVAWLLNTDPADHL